MKAAIDIVIVSWNSKEFISSCLESIFRTGLVDSHIGRVVVVDNGSSDDTVNCVRACGFPVILIENTNNLGFSKACNQGAMKCSSDLILFLNPDTAINKDSILTVLRYSLEQSSSDIGIFGLPMLDDHGESTCGARFPTVKSFIASTLPPAICKKLRFNRSTLMKASELPANRDIDQVIGAFFMVRSGLYAELKGFDERFFVYFEEVDFSLRAANIGWRSHIVNAPAIYHFGGGSSNSVKALRLFYSLNSRLLYCAKHFSKLNFLIVVFITFLLEPVSRIASELLKRNFTAIGEIIYAYVLLVGDFLGLVKRGK